jgi:hypothetical protein
MTLKHFGTLCLYLSTKQNKFGCSVGCGYLVRKDDHQHVKQEVVGIFGTFASLGQAVTVLFFCIDSVSNHFCNGLKQSTQHIELSGPFTCQPVAFLFETLPNLLNYLLGSLDEFCSSFLLGLHLAGLFIPFFKDFS